MMAIGAETVRVASVPSRLPSFFTVRLAIVAMTKTPSVARGPSPMAPKGEPGCRRHRSASVGEPPRGVDGIRRPKIACRRQGGGGLQHPEEPSLGHSLPVKAGTEGSLRSEEQPSEIQSLMRI